MKAVVQTKYGAPEVLQVTEVEKPVPGNDEVLVRIVNAGVTVGDARLRGSRFPDIFWLPARMMFGLFKPRKTRPGWELCGRVEEVGKEVTRFKPGDIVVATALGLTGGSYAEYITIPEERKSGLIVKVPDGVSTEEAGAGIVGSLTALHFLRLGNVREGTRILIYGASGSLGTFAVQLAKLFGAEVTGVCSTSNVDFVKELGADHVIDYKNEDFSESNQKYDVVFDTVGLANFKKCLSVLTENGLLLLANANGGHLMRMLWTGITSKKKAINSLATEKNGDMEYLLDLMAQGKLRTVIDKKYSLDQIAEAHHHVDNGHKRGHVVLEIG